MIQFQDRAASAVERIDNPGHDNHKIQPVAARETGMSWPVNFCEWDSQAVAELTLAHVARLWNKRAMKSSMSSRFDAAIRGFHETENADHRREERHEHEESDDEQEAREQSRLAECITQISEEVFHWQGDFPGPPNTTPVSVAISTRVSAAHHVQITDYH